MQTMKDLPYGKIGEQARDYTLPEDTLLSDEAFSNRADVVARAGEVVKIQCLPVFGLVMHPVHGRFRY